MAKKCIINIPKVTGNLIINASAKLIEEIPPETPETPPATGIPCTKLTLSLKAINMSSVGEKVTIFATKTPENSTDTVTWESNNTKVATVNSNGVVTAVGNGTCSIIAKCGEQVAVCPIIVYILKPCTSISLNKTTLLIEKEESIQLTATAVPSDTTDSISWKSSDESIAIVENGLVTPLVLKGSCVITVTCGSQSATCQVTLDIKEKVDESLQLEGLLLNTTQNVIGGMDKTLTIKARKIPFEAPGTVIWSSTNTSVATVDQYGNVTSVAAGTCNITATCGEFSDSCSLTVNEVSDSVLYDFDLTENFDSLLVTNKSPRRTGFKLYPESENENCLVYITSKTPTVICPSASSVKATADMSFVTGKNGSAEITFSASSSVTNGYIRKKYRIFVDISDDVQNVDIVYNNPTITMENWKAKATQNGVTQYFDVSYKENDWHPCYVKSHAVTDSKGRIYYLALTSKGSSKFGKDGYHLDSGGGYTEGSAAGSGLYAMQPSMLYFNGFNMNLTVQNVNNSMDSVYLEKTLELFNSTLPALNMTVDQSSKNTVEYGGLDDPGIIGSCWMKPDSNGNYYFQINLNPTLLGNKFGTFNPSKPESNMSWYSTPVHEFGHLLGTSDSAAHTPSMYDYGRPYDLCYYLQPNDIAWIEYSHKELYNVDITTTQENINDQVTSLDLKPVKGEVEIMHFDYVQADDDLIDAIIECKLQYEDKCISQDALKLEYNIFKIIDPIILKGDLEFDTLKVNSKVVNIDQLKKYKLFLLKGKDAYYLCDPRNGLIEL